VGTGQNRPALVGLLALVLNLAGNDKVGLWDRDEPRYAVAVREMRERGDWITPSFNGEPRYHKPILIYWVMRLGTAIAGDNPFGLRLGSAIAGAATCVVTWWLGRAMFGPLVGTLGALALATSPIMVIESKLATPDAILTLSMIVAQTCLWRLNGRESVAAALGFWTALALAFLTKGPVGPVLIAVSGLVTWWFSGPTSCWRRLRWRAGLGLFALITLPWYLMIGITSRGDFFRYAVGVQILQRISTGLEEHGGFPGYYLASTLLTFYPWSALLPAAVLGAWTRRKTSPTFGFLLGWAIGPLLLLELVRTKLVHYYLPAMPALALLAAWLLKAVGQDVVNLRRWPLGRLSLGLMGGVGVAIVATLVAGAFMLPAGFGPPLLVLAGLLAIGMLVGLTQFYRGRPILGGWVLAGSWAGFALVLSAWLLPIAEPHRLSRVVGERLAVLAETERAAPILLTFQEPGILYSMKRYAPTLRDWDEVSRSLDRSSTLVTAITPEQVISLVEDGRFVVDVLEELDGFNINKGKPQPIRLARIRSVTPRLAGHAVEESRVK
jgi:4-amino-4-deoxy-L-arabinose transferase-like glycosyltransferase